MNVVNQDRQQRETTRGLQPNRGTNVKPVAYARPARHLVVFEVDRQSYALPIDPIEQIIEMVTITPIPQVNTHLEGIINVRGIVVPVVNLGLILGYTATKLLLHTPIILVWVRGRMVGLIVDQVLDVIYVNGDQVVDPTEMLPEGLGGFPMLAGVVRSPERTVLLLDMERLFTTRRAGLAETLAAFSVIDEPVAAENVLVSPDEGVGDADAGSQDGDGVDGDAPVLAATAASPGDGSETDGEGVPEGRDGWMANKLVRRKLAARRRASVADDGDDSDEGEEPAGASA